MLDAIAEIDNLGMEDSTFVADASTTSFDTNAALGESQGSSIQSADFDQSLMDMLSSLETLADGTNPSLKIVSGQSLEDALADAIPGLDPTTVTPPAPLAENSSLKIAEDSSLNPFMMAALSELDDLESLGEAFQTVSDGFEGLSNSFEQLAASFLTQDSDIDAAAIGDNSSAVLEEKDIAIGNQSNDADTSLDANPVAIKNMSGDDGNTNSSTDSDTDSNVHSDKHSGDHSDKHSDKMAIASDADDINADFGISNLISDDINADFGISNLMSNDDDVALGTDFNLDFEALKVNIDQVSRGLQFLVQQLEAAFESDDLALTNVTK